MQSVNLTCHTDRTQLTLQGALDVAGTRTAYDTFNEALMRALPVELDAAALERVDAAGLQLLLAFVQTARDRGVALQWQTVGPALGAGAEVLGLTSALELPR